MKPQKLNKRVWPTKFGSITDDFGPRQQSLLLKGVGIARGNRRCSPTLRDFKPGDVHVLTQRGYETAVQGPNGFVCVVDRAGQAPFADPEFPNHRYRRRSASTPRPSDRFCRPRSSGRSWLWRGGPRPRSWIASNCERQQGVRAPRNRGNVLYDLEGTAPRRSVRALAAPSHVLHPQHGRRQPLGANVPNSPVVAGTNL
jgi:hypothetical protein